ncbi:HDOD domain-containing protein [Zoogloea sp.]|uniref:HDOD domain-containing protein n=1 Tax=Zoogloea sp. TaxID=49181 RepID=UPI0026177E75|nr:HDOD domain-containing protein [Zoogloea sp.]MDD3352379.1 HDOD domain-containing protein [Zoogloea sp.]
MATSTDPKSASLTIDADIAQSLARVRIPPCPAIVTEILCEIQKDDPQIKVLNRIIASDVGISAMAVKLANSAIFGNAAKVTSVQQAVNRLGTANILNVVVDAALRKSSDGLPSQLMEKFWSRASSLALAAGLLARRHVGIAPDAAYTYALFHDAAIPVMMQNFPDYAPLYAASEGDGAQLIAQERAHFHCDHAVAGWLLARNWGLPEPIALAIRYHHDPEAYILPESTLPSNSLALIAVTIIAEHVVGEFIGDADLIDNRAFEDARLFLGSSDADLDEFQEIIAAALA